MADYVVLVPFARMTPANGTEAFTHGDIVSMSEKEAAGMVEAGIIAPVAKESPAEAGETPKPKKAKAQK